jgi:hypothetical protein
MILVSHNILNYIRGKSPIMWSFPNLGKRSISHQEVLRSVLKNVNHLAVEFILLNHITNCQLLKISVLTGCLCFGVL